MSTVEHPKRATSRRTGVHAGSVQGTAKAKTADATRRAKSGTELAATAESRAETSRRTAGALLAGGAKPARLSARAAQAKAEAAQRLADGIELAHHRLTIDGKSFALDSLPDRTLSGALLRAARAACDAPENPFNAMTPKARAELAQDLAPHLQFESKSSGRATQLGLTSRSAAFALLARLIPAMKTRGEEPAQRAAVGLLLDAAGGEKHNALRETMIADLRAIPDKSLLARERARKDVLIGELLHETSPRDTWFGDNPHPELRVHVSVMDEFYKSELKAYRDNGYEVVRHGNKAVATKTLQDDRGRDVKIHIDIVQGQDQVLDPLADPKTHIVLYSGHAQLGGVTKISLEHAPRKEAGPKVVGIFACRGKQSLPALERAYPGGHFVVSDQGTYPHDDRIVVQRLIDGIARGTSYGDIEKGAQREGLWERNNYIFPNEALQLAKEDFSGAGKIMGDAPTSPVVFEPKLVDKAGRSMTMKPLRNAPDPDTLAGDRVVDAVAWFNTIYGYWGEDFGNREDKKLKDRLIPGGWFRSKDPSEIVRLEEQKDAAGKTVLEVKVNSAYAAQSPDSLAMMVSFALGMAVQKRTRPQEDEETQRMRSLAMVGSYVYFLVEYSDVADDLLKRFAKRFDFPPALSWPVVSKAVMSDMEKDCSPKVLRALELGMEYPFLEVNPNRTSKEFRAYIGRGLDALRKNGTPIAMKTFEAITSGRVRVDDLADLTPHDFKTAHAGFAKEGVELPISDLLHLKDGRVSSMRKLNASIDGYEWDNRIYVHLGLSTQRLMETLVHEVDHVLNESEEHYQGAKQILVEEYRALYAEKLLAGKVPDAAECRRLKEQIIRDYELEGVTVKDVADRPPGILE